MGLYRSGKNRARRDKLAMPLCRHVFTETIQYKSNNLLNLFKIRQVFLDFLSRIKRNVKLYCVKLDPNIDSKYSVYG